MKQQVTPSAPPTGTPLLYPELPAGPAVADVPSQHGNTPLDQYFRLQEISQLRKHLEDERDKRSQLHKKYRSRINAVDAVDTVLISASVRMGIGGVGLLSTIIAAPVVLGLEIAALGCGLFGVVGKFISRRLLVKVKKHDEIRVLAESKLNNIADHVSKALADGQISDEEFRLIIDEAQKYTQMKAEIPPPPPPPPCIYYLAFLRNWNESPWGQTPGLFLEFFHFGNAGTASKNTQQDNSQN